MAERQLKIYRKWTRSLLDRLIVLGASSSEIMEAVRRRRVSRDIVETESLGVLEHAVVCKLGTDAVGLIPKIGGRLPHASFAIFEAEKILNFLGDYRVL